MNWLVAIGTAVGRLDVSLPVVCAHTQTHSVLALEDHEPQGQHQDERTSFRPNNRETNISANDVSLDYPIYDITSRSLKQMFMLRPIANVFRGAAHVGGSIATGASGTVVVRAIDQMSFEIGRGERVGLIGHNGAGKTTLLRTMAGIYEPTGGSLKTQWPRHAAVQSYGRNDAGCHRARIHPYPRHSARP